MCVLQCVCVVAVCVVATCICTYTTTSSGTSGGSLCVCCSVCVLLQCVL